MVFYHVPDFSACLVQQSQLRLFVGRPTNGLTQPGDHINDGIEGFGGVLVELLASQVQFVGQHVPDVLANLDEQLIHFLLIRRFRIQGGVGNQE